MSVALLCRLLGCLMDDPPWVKAPSRLFGHLSGARVLTCSRCGRREHEWTSGFRRMNRRRRKLRLRATDTGGDHGE